MNESEKRRKQLLESTRSLYGERRGNPAVHPRHRAIYGSLYHEDNDDEITPSTFSLRVTVCILLFICFVGMDYQDMAFRQVDSQRICKEITYQVDVMEVWNNL